MLFIDWQICLWLKTTVFGHRVYIITKKAMQINLWQLHGFLYFTLWVQNSLVNRWTRCLPIICAPGSLWKLPPLAESCLTNCYLPEQKKALLKIFDLSFVPHGFQQEYIEPVTCAQSNPRLSAGIEEEGIVKRSPGQFQSLLLTSWVTLHKTFILSKVHVPHVRI